LFLYKKNKRLLELSLGEANFEIEIEIKILTAPSEFLLLWQNYKLEYIHGNYYLNTKHLLSGEKLIFEIQNYFEGRKMMFKTRIKSL